MPDSEADRWWLDLGDVRESARVWVNGRPAGAVVAHPFRVDVTGLLKPGGNEIAIEVTNLSANRIRDLDRRGVDWKKFHDINFVDHMYKPFDASDWDTKPSGLLGPVTLVPHRTVDTVDTDRAVALQGQQDPIALVTSVSMRWRAAIQKQIAFCSAVLFRSACVIHLDTITRAACRNPGTSSVITHAPWRGRPWERGTRGRIGLGTADGNWARPPLMLCIDSRGLSAHGV